jgi:uncharacterized protein
MTERAVPCGVCTLCCRSGEAIVLHPEDGDVIENYETEVVWHPLTKDRAISILKQKPNGDCIYVGPFGCTIHAKRPLICREFDCRGFYEKMKGARGRKLVKQGLASQAVLDRGRELLKAGM